MNDLNTNFPWGERSGTAPFPLDTTLRPEQDKVSPGTGSSSKVELASTSFPGYSNNEPFFPTPYTSPKLQLSASSSARVEQIPTTQCDRCGMRFEGMHGPGNLMRHKRSQKCSGVKKHDYVCHICGKVYARENGLALHKKYKHPSWGTESSKKPMEGTSTLDNLHLGKVDLAPAPIPLDSGYHSGLGIETESVCSMNSSGNSLGLPQNFLQDFIGYFGDTLIEQAGAREWAGYALVHNSSEEIQKQLNTLLKKYTVEMQEKYLHPDRADNRPNLSDSAQRQAFNGAAHLIRRYRPKISQYFCENAAYEPVSVTSSSERLQSPGQNRSLIGRVAQSMKSIMHTQDSSETTPELQYEEEDITDDELAHLYANLGLIRKILITNDAFERLCLDLRRTLYLDNMRDMEVVRLAMLKGMEVLDGIPDSQNHFKIKVDWNLVDFMRSQYGPNLPSIRSVVVLAGSALYAQATTCGEYIKTTWPKTEASLIEFLDTTLQELKKFPPGNKPLVTRRDAANLSLALHVEVDSNGIFWFKVASAEEERCVEIAQQIAWIGSAFSTSPFGEDLAYSKPCFRSTSESMFEVTFEYTPLHTTEQACWLPLFRGAVIASGFPIPDRANEVGLEIPLDLLAGIGGVRHAVEFEGGVVMKGFSHMFVPVRKSGDRVQWHAITSKDPETRLTYREGLCHCKSRALIHEVSLADLQSCRAIVGWCSVAESRLGSDSVNYGNIDYSGAQEADSALRCAGGSIGFQQFGMASIDFRLGAKDGKSHFQRRGPYQRIVSAAEKTPVALYDTGDQRAWLVRASDVMLHVLQHRHYLEPFEMNGSAIKLNTNVPPESTAKEVLLRNRSIPLSDTDEYAFHNAILDIWSLLEFLIDQNVTRERNATGAAIKPSFSESISGFEFKAVVEERSPFRQKQTPVKKMNGGWLQLVRDIDALVLFANGFEDLILPADPQKSNNCRRWQRVPKGQDFLATSTKMLKELYDVAGCRLCHTYLTSTKLQWYQGNSVNLDSCVGSHACECNPLQQIYAPSIFGGPAVPPKQILDQGAVIFGRSGSMAKQLWSKSRTEPSKTPGLFSQPNVSLTPIMISPSDFEGLKIPDYEPGAEAARTIPQISSPPAFHHSRRCSQSRNLRNLGI